MRILSFETSCDETAVAFVEVDTSASQHHNLIAQRIYSQYDEHFDYGGVVPEIASRAHLERLPTLTQETLQEANITPADIDGIVATSGPGLTGGLLMGLTFARTLAMTWKKPFLGVNHIEGHALSPLLENPDLHFPYLLVLVSGGHCQLVHVEGVGQYTTLGATRDDAAGECFDKAARVLGLGHPGGPALEKAAANGIENAVIFPIPQVEGIDFSFSGLKTAVLNHINNTKPLSEQDVANTALGLQTAVTKHLTQKINIALTQTSSKTLVVAGGVAANRSIRNALKELAAQHEAHFFAPSLRLCTDNAAMIALAGGLRLSHIKENPTWHGGVRPRWPLDEMKETTL